MAKKYKIERVKKGNKWDIFGKAELLSDIEGFNASHIEIIGNNRLSLEGCFGVLEYNDSYMKLKLCKGSLIIWGSGFDILLFENRLITVKGKISSIEFCV